MVEIETGEKSPGMLRVFNTMGELVLERTRFADHEMLDLSAFPAGHYTMEWRSKTGGLKTGKLVRIK